VRHQQSSLIDEFQVNLKGNRWLSSKVIRIEQLLAEVNKQMIAAA